VNGKKIESEWAKVIKEKEKQLSESIALMEQREEIVKKRKKLESDQKKFEEDVRIEKNNLEKLKLQIHVTSRKSSSVIEEPKLDDSQYDNKEMEGSPAEVESEIISLRERLKQDTDKLDAELKKSQEEKLEWEKVKQKMEKELQSSQQDLEREKTHLTTQKLKVEREVKLINEGTSHLHKLKTLLDVLRETEREL